MADSLRLFDRVTRLFDAAVPESAPKFPRFVVLILRIAPGFAYVSTCLRTEFAGQPPTAAIPESPDGNWSNHL